MVCSLPNIRAKPSLRNWHKRPGLLLFSIPPIKDIQQKNIASRDVRKHVWAGCDRTVCHTVFLSYCYIQIHWTCILGLLCYCNLETLWWICVYSLPHSASSLSLRRRKYSGKRQRKPANLSTSGSYRSCSEGRCGGSKTHNPKGVGALLPLSWMWKMKRRLRWGILVVSMRGFPSRFEQRSFFGSSLILRYTSEWSEAQSALWYEWVRSTCLRPVSLTMTMLSWCQWLDREWRHNTLCCDFVWK